MHVSVPRQKCATCESFILFFYQRQLACQGPMFHTSLPPLISQLVQLLWSLLILSPSKPLLCLTVPLPSQNLMGRDANPSSFLHFLCTHSFHTGQFWEARGCTPANGERLTHLLISPPVQDENFRHTFLCKTMLFAELLLVLPFLTPGLLCACFYHRGHLWESEDTFGELVLSFYLGSRSWTEGVRPLLSHGLYWAIWQIHFVL